MPIGTSRHPLNVAGIICSIVVLYVIMLVCHIIVRDAWLFEAKRREHPLIEPAVIPQLPDTPGRLVGLNKELVESAQVMCCANVHLAVRAYRVAPGTRNDEGPAYPEGTRAIKFAIAGWRYARTQQYTYTCIYIYITEL